MFDVGFSEMVVIAVVALIVLGPERLPKVARTVGHLLGRLNRYVNEVKADINREMELEELRKFKEQFQDAATSFEQTIHKEMSGVQDNLEQIQKAATAAPSEPPPAAEAAPAGQSPAAPPALPDAAQGPGAAGRAAP